MKRYICLGLALMLILGVFAFGTSAKAVFSPYEDANGVRKYCACGNCFVADQAAAGKPLLGICLGMQMLFEKSFEYGEHPGLSLLKGSVVSMAGVIPESLKVPHMGWNKLEFTKNSSLFTHISQGDYVYFVHSYFASDCPDSVCAVSEYGEKLTAAVEKGNIYGCQFHPEKSGQVGLNILKAFCEV